MKKPVCLILICLVSAVSYAFGSHGRSPVLDNTSIRRSERAMNAQTRSFQTHRRYSSEVNSHRAKALRKEHAKDGQGL
ncbi:MAG TPA: hypothetical protein VK808_05195 [Bacteroidia bacterium]|nr:hypothetical protein [Bacteroidia bacterium]